LRALPFFWVYFPLSLSIIFWPISRSLEPKHPAGRADNHRKESHICPEEFPHLYFSHARPFSTAPPAIFLRRRLSDSGATQTSRETDS